MRRITEVWSRCSKLHECNAQYNGRCYRRLTASSGRECHRSFEDLNKTVTSGEECVEYPRVEVDAVSSMNAMRNTMAGITGD